MSAKIDGEEWSATSVTGLFSADSVDEENALTLVGTKGSEELSLVVSNDFGGDEISIGNYEIGGIEENALLIFSTEEIFAVALEGDITITKFDRRTGPIVSGTFNNIKLLDVISSDTIVINDGVFENIIYFTVD